MMSTVAQWADPKCSGKCDTVFKGVAVGNLDEAAWPEVAVPAAEA